MRRILLLVVAAVVLIAGGYWFLVRDTDRVATLVSVQPTAAIGSGSSAVAVGADGAILTWLPPPKDSTLPRLPISEPPERGRLTGTVLQQAIVLGAAPAALRPHLQSSRYGDSGVDVELRDGIELRFGDSSRAAEKWRAAATVLADPSITALDYVDLHAPARPAVYGSGHVLPTVP